MLSTCIYIYVHIIYFSKQYVLKNLTPQNISAATKLSVGKAPMFDGKPTVSA